MGGKFSVLRAGHPIYKLQVVVFKDGNCWEMIVLCYHYSLGGRVSLPDFRCDGIRIWNLNVAVICDSSWSGAVPVAASVEACFFYR